MSRNDSHGRELARRRRDLELAAQYHPSENSDRLLAEAIANEESYLGNVFVGTGGNYQNAQSTQYSQDNQYTHHSQTDRRTTNDTFVYSPQINNVNLTVNYHNPQIADNRHVTNNINSGNHGSYNTSSNDNNRHVSNNINSGNNGSYNTSSNDTNNRASNNTGWNNTAHHPACPNAISPPTAPAAPNPQGAPPSKQAYRVREAVLTKCETKSSSNFLYPSATKTTWSNDRGCRVEKCKSRATHYTVKSTTYYHTPGTRLDSIFCKDHSCKSELSNGGKNGQYCRVPKHPWDSFCSDCQ